MIIRNKHNLNIEEVEEINNIILNSWFIDIYGKSEVFKKNIVFLGGLKKGDFENNIIFMEDLIRVMKKNISPEIFNNIVFEIIYLDEIIKYEKINVAAIKFVLKNGSLLKFIGNAEEIPFISI